MIDHGFGQGKSAARQQEPFGGREAKVREETQPEKETVGTKPGLSLIEGREEMIGVGKGASL